MGMKNTTKSMIIKPRKTIMHGGGVGVSKDNPEAKVQVKTYFSTGLTNKRGPFKPYNGNPKYMDVPVGDI